MEEVAAIAAEHGIAVDPGDAERCAEAMAAVLAGERSGAGPPAAGPPAAGGRAAAGEPDDPLNALVRRCELPASQLGPLSGLRLAIKDSIAVGGVPMSAGSEALGGFVPSADSEAVKRLRAAGAEIVAIANMDDLAISGAGDSSRYGPTANPHDPGRGAGGSSSGSAAALSYEGIDASLGTDLAGSVRIPASWCGVLGLKPSRGLIPVQGALIADPALDTIGPMARSTQPLAGLLAVLADATVTERAGYLAATTNGDLSGVRIAALAEGFSPRLGVETEVADAVRAGLARCGELEADVSERSLPTHAGAAAAFAPFGFAAAAALLDGAPAAGWPELTAALGPGVRDNWRQLALVVKVAGLLGWRQQWAGGIPASARTARAALARGFDRLLGEVDAIAMPATPSVARRHLDPAATPAETVAHAWANAVNTSAANLTGHPAITLPVASSEGLPVGLQLIGREGSEATLLRVAAAYEAAFGWAS